MGEHYEPFMQTEGREQKWCPNSCYLAGRCRCGRAGREQTPCPFCGHTCEQYVTPDRMLVCEDCGAQYEPLAPAREQTPRNTTGGPT